MERERDERNGLDTDGWKENTKTSEEWKKRREARDGWTGGGGGVTERRGPSVLNRHDVPDRRNQCFPVFLEGAVRKRAQT